MSQIKQVRQPSAFVAAILTLGYHQAAARAHVVEEHNRRRLPIPADLPFEISLTVAPVAEDVAPAPAPAPARNWLSEVNLDTKPGS